jgi:hypothetical protein
MRIFNESILFLFLRMDGEDVVAGDKAVTDDKELLNVPEGRLRPLIFIKRVK